MWQSLIKRIKRVRAQRRQALDARIQERDSRFAALERTLQDLADHVRASGNEIDANRQRTLSSLRRNWNKMFEAGQALPEGEEKQRILDALKKQEAAILRLEQVAKPTR